MTKLLLSPCQWTVCKSVTISLLNEIDDFNIILNKFVIETFRLGCFLVSAIASSVLLNVIS